MTEQRIDLGLTASTAPSGGCGDSCGCGHAGVPTSATAAPASQELRVEGMTCAHCVRAVTDELNAVEGVEVVDVDLRAGGVTTVRISTNGAVSTEDLAAAVDEAGYTLSR
ncbi:heavy-metal-associated domain-containing protein [Microbacterium sp. NPDC090007]|uniref:heavy-metal-associated domain-containing protein n=1 Tax=Microbacterium sp. NPDC090007 TaxID=3364204 RepID=UPI0037F2E565